MKQWFTTNAGLKTVALVLAIFVWFFVRAITSDLRTVEGVPVEVKAGAGMAVTFYSPKTVNVTVRGTTDDLRLVSRNELFAVLDMTRQERVGRQQAVLSGRDIRHPRRVQVISVEPTNIIVRLEKSVD